MKIVIVAGGTGGHLYPALAIARALPGQEILFIVRRGDLGREIVMKEGYRVREIAGAGLPRTLSWRWVAFPFKFIWGWVEAWSLLRTCRPDWVIGMGGYLSVPVMMTACLMGRKTLLHEQNVFPGLANRWLSRCVDSVAVSFPASQTHFPQGKTWVSGLPVREDIGTADKLRARQELGLEALPVTFLIFGGSQGARALNEKILEAWSLLAKENRPFQVLHFTGAASFEKIQQKYTALPIRAVVLPYCHAMANAYAAADWVICRAGASTIAELLAAQKPATLIPYPFASNNHQLYNARILKELGVAEIVLENEFRPEVFSRHMRELLDDPRRLADYRERYSVLPKTLIRSHAAQQVAEFLTGPH